MEEKQEVLIQQQYVPQSEVVNQGSVAIEQSRAVAEAQGAMVLAKRFPRDYNKAYAMAMQSCQRKGFADSAFYSYPRGKETVNGVTIRFAEELARCYGNLDFGIKELSTSDGKTEMQAYCWDMETNTKSVQNFTNPHKRDAYGKQVDLTSQRDIYELNANMGARRLRSRILAILPPDLVEDCVQECRKTLKGDNTIPFADKIKNMVVAFQKLGVTQEMLETRLGHKIDTLTPDELADYVGIFNGIKGKETKIAEWFEQPKQASEVTDLLKGKKEEK